MTTGNKHWAIGRAVERAFADKGATFHAYQNGRNDDWMVRDAQTSHPRNFVRRFATQYIFVSATVAVTESGQ